VDGFPLPLSSYRPSPRPLNYLSGRVAELPIPQGHQTLTSVTIDTQKPILFLDVDGVISLFGFPSSQKRMPGPFHWIDGVAHCIPDALGPRLERLSEVFELVWSTGWEEKANEYLPFILKLSFRDLPVLTFGGRAVFGSSHWKLAAMDEYAGSRPAAWIDDNIDEECEAWAKNRAAPTLLVRTKSATGMTDEHVEKLLKWARKNAGTSSEPPADGSGEDAPAPPPAEAGAGSRFSFPWRRARN